MKKLTFIFAGTCLAFSATQAMAENTGCGWGTMVFEGQQGKAQEVLAVTTNGTFGNQTFGITSGTAGCEEGSTIAAANVQKFASANMEKLARDMAVGSGETLESFAGVIGIKEEHKAKFFAKTKENFIQLFPSADVTTEAMLKTLNGVMATDAELAPYAV